MFYEKRCSYKLHKIHRKTRVPESLFNKIAGLRAATLSKKKVWHRGFPVNFAKYLWTRYFKTPLGDCFWFVACFFNFPLSKIFATRKAASCEKNWLVENRLKGSHQNPSFETFKYHGENLPYSSCHFPNH